MSTPECDLSVRFRDLLERHVQQFTIRGTKGRGCCPLHNDRTPSFSADMEKNIWYCFGCNTGGGVKRLAELMGEPWEMTLLPRAERWRIAVTLQRRDAERRASAILRERHEAHLDAVWAEWRDANGDATNAAALMAMFHRRPDLEAEFFDVATQAVRQYGVAIHRCTWLEAMIADEVTI